jgi:hypothetical protein
MGQGAYIAGAIAANFIRLTLNQSAFVYLYQVAPNGETRLLSPNRSAGNNFLQAGEYAFPEDFMAGFPLGSPGAYTVQGIATLLPVAGLSPGADLFRLLALDPEVVRQGVELLIAQSGLTAAQWTAAWTQYQVLELQPTAEGPLPTPVAIKVQDYSGNPIPAEYDPSVHIDNLDQQGNVTKPFINWWPLPQSALSYNANVNDAPFQLVQARANDYSPYPQTECSVAHGNQRASLLAPCKLEISPGDDLNVTFTLLPAVGPLAWFEFQPLQACAEQAVQFDASPSRPQGQIQNYLWDFGDKTPPKLQQTPTVSHAYTSPGSYTVRLVVTFADSNQPQQATRVVSVQTGGTQGCISTLSTEIDPSNDPTQASYTRDPTTGAITETVRNGYASVPAQVALPPRGDVLNLSFNYHIIIPFPTAEYQAQPPQVLVLSYVSVVFLDKNDQPLQPPQLEQILYTIDGSAVPPSQGSIQRRIIVPSVPHDQLHIGVLVVTDVHTWGTAAPTNPPGVPVTITYSDFQLEPVTDQDPPCENQHATLYTLKQIYQLGETVQWIFTNPYPSLITLRNWRVQDHKTGLVVFGSMDLSSVAPIPQGLSFMGTWDERDNTKNLVPPGVLYDLVVQAQETTCQAPFGIIAP